MVDKMKEERVKRGETIKTIEDLWEREPFRTLFDISSIVEEPLYPRDFNYIMLRKDYSRGEKRTLWEKWWKSGHIKIEGKKKHLYARDDWIKIPQFNFTCQYLHKCLKRLMREGIFAQDEKRRYFLTKKWKKEWLRAYCHNILDEYDVKEIVDGFHITTFGIPKDAVLSLTKKLFEFQANNQLSKPFVIMCTPP